MEPATPFTNASSCAPAVSVSVVVHVFWEHTKEPWLFEHCWVSGRTGITRMDGS